MTLLAGHGYGYKIWRAARDCFAFLGMGGQLMIACPKYNVLMAATSDEQGNGTGYHLLAEAFYRFVLDNLDEFGAEPKTENPAALADLRDYTANLTCPLTFLGERDSAFSPEVFGRTYVMRENPMQIEWFRLEKTENGGKFVFFARGEEKTIPFGFGEYEIAPFPETCYWGRTMRTPSGKGYRTMSAGLWTEEKKFVVRSYLIDDYFGNLTTTFAFKGEECSLYMSKTAEDFLWHYEGAGVADRK